MQKILTTLRYLSFASLLAFANHSLAAIPASSAEQLLHAAKFDQHASAMQSKMRGGMLKEVLDDFDDEQLNLAGKMYDAQFTQLNLHQSVATELANELSEEQAQFVLAFFNSELGQLVTNAEVAFEQEANTKKVSKIGKKLRRKKAIKAFARNVDEKTGESTIGARIATVIVNFMLDINLKEGDEEVQEKKSSGFFGSIMESMIGDLSEDVKDDTIIDLAYTFRDFNQTQRQQYLDFLNNPLSDKYYEIVSQVTAKELANTLKQWFKETEKLKD